MRSGSVLQSREHTFRFKRSTPSKDKKKICGLDESNGPGLYFEIREEAENQALG